MSDNLFESFQIKLSFSNGSLVPCSKHWLRILSEMSEVFLDSKKAQKILTKENPIIYEVYEYTTPQEEGHLIPVTTVIHPGMIGNEFFMTKGHYHAQRGTAEIYVILKGEGVLLMQSETGKTSEKTFDVGDLVYMPPFWAHRMVNTGEESLIFYGVYPAHAGHDYDTIKLAGFKKRVFSNKRNRKNFKFKITECSNE